MTACPDENELALLAEAALAEADRVAIERHLDDCASCSRLVGELAALAAPGRAYPERYRLIRQLGAGAMGVVWEAEDTELGRRVALKWIAPDPSGDAAADRERRGRLYREARALAQLRHANVLAVHDVGEVGDQLFLALELVVGTTARAWLAAAPRSPEDIVALWRAVGAGLAAVHRAGIVHRDVKPDNVLVADDGRVLLGDFGLATAAVGDTTDLTQTGQVLGTPLYMAPEQLHGEPATARSDQFALCVCLWEALAKTRPFTGATFGALAVAMLAPPKLPPGENRERFALLARGLARDPRDRWPDVDALVAALAAAPRRRDRLAIAGLAGVALAGTGAWWALHDRGADEARIAADREDRDLRRSAGSDPRGHVDANAGSDLDADAGADLRGNVGTAKTGSDSGGNAAGDPRRYIATDSRTNTGSGANRPGSGGRVEIADAPVPPPSSSRYVSGWRGHYDHAIDLLGLGNGPGCLAELALIQSPAPVLVDDIAFMHPSCVMLTDCAAGRAELERLGRDRGWDATRIAQVLDRDDTAFCPIDAPPTTRWPARAMYRLQLALSRHASCAPVLAFIDRHHLVLPENIDLTRVACMVQDGDCAPARATYVAVVRGGAPADDRELARLGQQFDRVYPSCNTP
jgi:hypothetical protein